MAKVDTLFPSKYLKAADLNDREVRLVIISCEIETIGDDDKKPVLYFSKSKKGLVCNKTNAKVIAGAYGNDTDDWGGKEIILFPMMVQFQSDMVESIRVKIPKPAQAPKAAPQAHSDLEPPPFDDPPFDP